MFWLAVETFILVAVTVALGLGLGIVARRFAARSAALAGQTGGPRLAEIMQEAIAAEERAGPVPGTVDPGLSIIDPERAAAADQVGLRPMALSGPRDGAADDLVDLLGLDAATARRLNAIGVFHLDQIAAWTAEERAWIETYLGTAEPSGSDWIAAAGARSGR